MPCFIYIIRTSLYLLLSEIDFGFSVPSAFIRVPHDDVTDVLTADVSLTAWWEINRQEISARKDRINLVCLYFFLLLKTNYFLFWQLKNNVELTKVGQHALQTKSAAQRIKSM